MFNLIDASHAWTMGACVLWNLQTKQFADMASTAFLDFVNRTHTVVYRYIKGQKTLDGSCSDLECTLAHQARIIFAPHLQA